MSWLSAMNGWVVDLLEPHGLGVILLVLLIVAFAESSFFPVPPDVILLAFVLEWRELFLVFALIASVGSVLGGLFGHWLGLRGGRPLAQRYLDPGKMARAEYYFERWGAWAVGIAGFSPIPYKVFTITAGALRMDRHRFLVASALSRSARFFLEATLLFALGRQIRDFIESPQFNLLTLIGVVGLAAVFYYRSKRAERERPLFGAPPTAGPSADDLEPPRRDHPMSSDPAAVQEGEGAQPAEPNEAGTGSGR